MKERRSELVELAARLPEGSISVRDGALTALHFHAHKLSGIAESYGFAEVGDIGRAVDDAIVAIKDGSASEITRDQVLLWVQQLVAAIDRALH